MNKKVLKSTIYLCWVFLICFAIIKIFFAEPFVAVVNNEKIITIGRFIDSHIIIKQIVHIATTLLTYQFYLCACCRKWHLDKKQYLICAIILIPTVFLNWYFPSIMVGINFVLMFVIPYFLKANYKDVCIFFTAHILGQTLVQFIRSEPMYLLDVNIVTQFICGIDAYIWLLLYYLYSNIYKESLLMGSFMPPLWGDKSREIEKEIEKLDEKIANTTDEKKLAKYKEMRAEYVSMLENSDKA